MTFARLLAGAAALSLLASPVLAQTAQPATPSKPAPAAPAKPAPPATPAAPAKPAAAAPAAAAPAKPAAAAPAAAAPAAAKPAAAQGQKVNLNTATAAELDGLPQIGDARSKAILEARAKGKFKDWNDFVSRNVIPKNAEDAIKDKVRF